MTCILFDRQRSIKVRTLFGEILSVSFSLMVVIFDTEKGSDKNLNLYFRLVNL